MSIGHSSERVRRSAHALRLMLCLLVKQENLKRHAALHTRSEDSACFTCDSCPTTFSRRDLLRRHKKKKHPGEEEPRSSVARTRPQGERPRSDEEVRSPTSSLIGQERRLQSSTGTADFDVDIGDWEMALPDAAHLSSSMPNVSSPVGVTLEFCAVALINVLRRKGQRHGARSARRGRSIHRTVFVR